MSDFFFEDTCAFKADPSIIGTVGRTWSEVDVDHSNGLTNCYIHRHLPPMVRKAWFEHETLSPGYVVLEFMHPCNGYCLVHESLLFLLDRGIAAGDVVKRSPSDAQSGTVLSTSVMCTLQPLCSETEYNKRHHIPAQGYTTSNGSHAPTNKAQPEPPKLNGSAPTKSDSLLDAPPVSSPLKVPAQELTYWNVYREEDFIIFNEWVGQVKSVYEEVTVRLTNGSVVAVENSAELEEPYWIPGTKSHELFQRLDRAGFYRYCSKENPPTPGKPLTIAAEPCYPGQHVQTKKGNLRCGRWLFGAYDPTVSPRGIVVDVRCIELEVRWLQPNQSIPLRDQAHPPPDLLTLDELESGQTLVYDRSRLPKHPVADQLPNASHSPDTGFGHRVRFRDPAGAAVKYRQVSAERSTDGLGASYFHRIPRSATQGFDMNVFQVMSTLTKVLVRWQDCTITEDLSTGLTPFLNTDEHDVWPGDKISYLPEEVHPNGDASGIIRVHKAGVVQFVDAAARIAKIRWYNDTKIDMDEEKAWQITGSTFGELGNKTTEVSLYEIAAHPAMAANRGDGAIILQDSESPSNSIAGGSSLLSAGIQRARGMLESVLPPSANQTIEFVAVAEPPPDKSNSNGIDWCGEIMDLCLDGQVLIRLGAAAEARDIKVPPDQVLVVSFSDLDNDSDYTDEDEDESGWTDDGYDSEMETINDSDEMSVEGFDISVEYEGGQNLDADGDDDMWLIEEEDDEDAGEHTSNPDELPDIAVASPPGETREGGNGDSEEMAQNGPDRAISFTSYALMPTQFAILEGAPDDHHFSRTARALTAILMRRIMRENGIMQHSLPDGVFVRTWESRLDLLRVLIVGPYDTPYEFAPFVFDLQLGTGFPISPPDVFFHSWTGNLGRINPNLYEDGKVCLSLLGTWDTDERNEAWSAKSSTILQIIVSLMGLVLVKEPYFNEAGFDVLIGSEETRVPSALYSEKVYVMSKAFIKTALTSPLQGIDDIVKWLYLSSQAEGPYLLRRVVEASRVSVSDMRTSGPSSQSFSRDGEGTAPVNLSAGALILLRRSLEWLEDYLLGFEKGRRRDHGEDV